MIIGDGMIGQMMEPVEFPDVLNEPPLPEKTWAATGAEGRKPVIIKSLYLDPYALEDNSYQLQKKYNQMKAEEIRYELYNVEPKNKTLIVSYGTMARICQTAIDELKTRGISVGLFRPISLFPYPEKELKKEAIKRNINTVLTVEMSCGQMVEDVERVVQGAKPVEFFGRTGGIVPSPEEVTGQLIKLLEKSKPKKKTAKKKAKKS